MSGGLDRSSPAGSRTTQVKQPKCPFRAKTPAPIVERVQQETAKALALPDVKTRLAAMAYDGVGSTLADFTSFYKIEIGKFTKVIADAKIPKQ